MHVYFLRRDVMVRRLLSGRRLLMQMHTQIVHSGFKEVENQLQAALAAELHLSLSDLTPSTQITGNEYHTTFLFKGLEAIALGHKLETAVLANKFDPLPDHPIHRLFMEEIFSCGAHAVGATHFRNAPPVTWLLPDPTAHPSPAPSAAPSFVPTPTPTHTPTELPTPVPSPTPSEVPTTLPPTTTEPSFDPTRTPTEPPTPSPTLTPTEAPSVLPTAVPSALAQQEVGGWRSSGTGGVDGWTNFNMVFPQTMYRFGSAGKVCSWKMHKVHSSSVKLQVYRGSGSTYTLIGENNIATTSTGTAYTYNVPSSQQITVQAGDYIGLRFSSPATIPFTGGGSVRWGSGPGHHDVPVGSAYTFPGSGGRQYAVTATLCQPAGPQYTFGNRASYCVTSNGGNREPTYYQLAMGKSMTDCAALVKARGYKYMNFWSNDGRCRGLHSCPYEKLSPNGYDGYCKTYTIG